MTIFTINNIVSNTFPEASVSYSPQNLTWKSQQFLTVITEFLLGTMPDNIKLLFLDVSVLGVFALILLYHIQRHSEIWSTNQNGRSVPCGHYKIKNNIPKAGFEPALLVTGKLKQAMLQLSSSSLLYYYNHSLHS